MTHDKVCIYECAGFSSKKSNDKKLGTYLIFPLPHTPVLVTYPPFLSKRISQRIKKFSLDLSIFLQKVANLFSKVK